MSCSFLNCGALLRVLSPGLNAELHADVVWGHPSGHSEAAFRENWQTSSDWPEATPEVVEELRENFARLVRAFESAIERGAPPEE
jgi:hypothetical protein